MDEALTNILALTALNWVYNDAEGDLLENEKLAQRNLDKFLQLVVFLENSPSPNVETGSKFRRCCDSGTAFSLD